MAARGRGRGRGRGNGNDNGNGGNAPITVEELMQTQNQMMHVFMQHLQQQPPPTPPPIHVRDKRGEFMKGRPPVFTHSADPMEADDWLRAVERQLNITQCNDLEKVLYASGQLQGQLKHGGSHIKLLVPTMLLLSHGWNSVKTSELDI